MTEMIFFDAKWEKEIKLGDDLLKYLKDNSMKTVALFASVQFLALDSVKEQLKNSNIEVKTTKAKRTHKEGQVLGCDAYHDSYEKNIIDDSDAILYVGDGMFHPKAVLLSQMYSENIKPLLLWDPVEEKFHIIDKNDIMREINKTRANLTRYIAAQTVGILVTIKPGQEYLSTARLLKKHLEKQGKTAYIFIDDTLSLQQFESYQFIDAWVNTACPRIGLDDITELQTPLINIREAFDPVESVGKLYKE